MKYEDFDTILYFDNLNESSVDDRVFPTRRIGGVDKPIVSPYVDYIDPKLYANWSFGKQLQSELSSMGRDYSCELVDFGKEIVVKITHNNVITGRTASKTFLITFTNTKGDAYVKSHSNKWRSISGLGQASQYIKSVCSNLQSATQTKM